MVYTPAGSLVTRYDAMRRTLAYSTRFRALTDTATEALALERIIFPEMADLWMEPEDLEQGLKYPRTRAIIDLKEDQWSIIPSSRGVGDEECPLLVRLEISIPEFWESTRIRDDDLVRKYWCEDMWRKVVQEMVDASRLSVHPTSGLPFIADSASYSVEREGLIDVTLPEHDLIHETFYAVDLTITDSSGV